LEDLVIYTSTQTHSLGVKAGLVLGLQVRAINVKLEDEFSLRGDTLKAALKEDAKLGKRPFILSKFRSFLGVLPSSIYYPVATVGTTSSGAIDNLPEIQEVGRTLHSRL
jgi:aromatic-L-amino-acid decarboxylase